MGSRGVGSYVSIPQQNRTLQKLAIDSLATYASTCAFFLVLAPDASHADTHLLCNQATYGRRGWHVYRNEPLPRSAFSSDTFPGWKCIGRCRLEQWAHATCGFVSP